MPAQLNHLQPCCTALSQLRFGLIALLGAALPGLALAAGPGPQVLIDTNGATTAAADGTLGTGEYENYSQGINQGFGGAAGQYSKLHIDSDSTGMLYFALERFDHAGGLNDFVVIYLDTAPGGGYADTSSFVDMGDGCRKAISGFDGTNRSTLTFPLGFAADYAICLEQNFAGLFVPNGSFPNHGFVASANLDCEVSVGGCFTNTAEAYEFAVPLSQMGLSPGATFNYLSTYISDTAYRSDEFHGVAQTTRPFVPAGDNIGQTDFALMPGDYNTFVSYGTCSETVLLIQDEWRLFGSPCNLGASNTVDHVFTDIAGFADSDYYDPGTNPTGNWVVYRRAYGAPDSYLRMALTDTLDPGRAYWAKYIATARGGSFNAVFSGARNSSPTDIPLQSDPAGRYNMVGHPYDLVVDWPDVRVVNMSGTVLTLDQADPGGLCTIGATQRVATCVMSSVMHKYDGESGGYYAYNGATPGMEGTLRPGDGIWVKAFESGISLRIPLVPAQAAAPASKAGNNEKRLAGQRDWQVRLIASAGAMRDAHNFIGQLEGSADQFDRNDLPELEPFDDTYLTLVFPQEKWGDYSGDYTSDHRSPNQSGDGTWTFEVRTSLPLGTEVTLSWEGPARALDNAVLLDFDNNTKPQAGAGGSYTFTLTAPVQRFGWQQNPWRFERDAGGPIRGKGR